MRRTWKFVKRCEGAFGFYDVWSSNYDLIRKVVLRRWDNPEPVVIWTDDQNYPPEGAEVR